MKRTKSLQLALFVGALTLVLSSCAGPPPPQGLEVTLDDSTKYCEMSVQKAPLDVPAQSVAILAPTNNFVDFQTVVTRSETEVKESLGGNLGSDQLEQAIGRELSVVIADGNPRMLAKRSVQPAGRSEYDIKSAIDSSFGIFRLANKCAAGTLKRPSDQVETAEGSNLLKALSIASDQLTTDGPRKIYVLGNGIQTTGAIEMQQPGIFPKSDGAAKRLARGLKSIGEIPDLEGAEIYWYGLGQVDGVNQQISEKASKSLESFWTEVIKLGNGKLMDICAQCGAGSPHIFSVPVPTFEIKTCTLIKLYEEDGVEFLADTATFKNLAKAKAAAKQISGQFEAKGCDEMEVTGFAAAGVNKSSYLADKNKIDSTNDALTKRRATAFAQLVRSAGYNGSISSTGGGTCGTEWNGSGGADSELQRLCRRVEVSN